MYNGRRFLLAVVFLVIFVVEATVQYSSICDTAFCRVLDGSYDEINKLKASVDSGVCIPGLGDQADQICNSALERFSTEAPLQDDSEENENVYDKKIDDLERMIDAPLHVIYLKQLSLLREKALKIFKQTLATSEGTEFDAMMQADELFRREATAATRQNPDWSYSKEVTALKTALLEIANRSRKANDAKIQASKQSQQAMQYLQMQQQQMQAMQQQMMGQSSKWNIGGAYRVPDTNINLSGSYQQGKGNIQISCVPDESLPLLGANGFVNGVTPGNLGISFNINI